MVADPTGLIDVIGTTQAGDYPTTAGAYAAVLYGSQDAFLSQIDPNAGVLVYSTYLGGELTDYGRAIAVDAKGLVYFADRHRFDAVSGCRLPVPIHFTGSHRHSRGGHGFHAVSRPLH